jgi:hypothetical protein
VPKGRLSVRPLRVNCSSPRCCHEGIGKRYTLAAQSARDAARSPATGSLDIEVSSRSVAIITLIPWASKRSRARRGGGTLDSRARASGPAQLGAVYPIYRPRISGILRCHEIFVVRKANERPPPVPPTLRERASVD